MKKGGRPGYYTRCPRVYLKMRGKGTNKKGSATISYLITLAFIATTFIYFLQRINIVNILFPSIIKNAIMMINPVK